MALTTLQKMGWGLADMGVVVFVVVKQLLVFAFLTNVLGVPVGLAGVVTTSVLLFDILTDPLVGTLSDRTETRWGRRFPWMGVGAVVMVIGIVGLFAVPESYAMAAQIAWVIGFFGLATLGFTCVAVPYGAMAGEMTDSPAERLAMTGWRMGFASIGILIGGALIPVLAANLGYAGAALAVSPVIVGAIWLSIYLTRNAPRKHTATEVGPIAALRLVAGNRAFLVLMVLYGVMTLAIAMITAGLPFAALYLITDSTPSALSGAAGALGMMPFLFAAFVIGAMLSQVIWVMLSRLMGKIGALVLGWACISSCWGCCSSTCRRVM